MKNKKNNGIKRLKKGLEDNGKQPLECRTNIKETNERRNKDQGITRSTREASPPKERSSGKRGRKAGRVKPRELSVLSPKGPHVARTAMGAGTVAGRRSHGNGSRFRALPGARSTQGAEVGRAAGVPPVLDAKYSEAASSKCRANSFK